jgi:hypothetical protein
MEGARPDGGSDDNSRGPAERSRPFRRDRAPRPYASGVTTYWRRWRSRKVTGPRGPGT